ncbi:MAG: DUF417 family protein [Bacteroidota bacterium]
MKKYFHSFGYFISVIGVATVLIWIGVFKFTPTEARGIEPLVKNSFLMKWMYNYASIEIVSKVVGSIEILTAVCLLLHFFWKKAGMIGGFFAAITFLLTLSFLFTTPGVFSTVDGVLITDFFILKDLMALGISFMVLGKS